MIFRPRNRIPHLIRILDRCFRHMDIWNRAGELYLVRWHIIPRNRRFNIYLHMFMRSDDRILHDHPWRSMSFLLKGRLREHMPHRTRDIVRFLPVFRSARHRHRLELTDGGPAWTLFVTGRVTRVWGFHCGGDTGWIPHTRYHREGCGD